MTAANLRKLQSVQSKWIRSTSRKRLAHCQFSFLISSDKISKQLESWLYFNKVWPCPQWLSCRAFFGEPTVLMVPLFVHHRRLTAFPQITIVVGQCCRRTISLLLDFREFVVKVLACGVWRTVCVAAHHHGGKHLCVFVRSRPINELCPHEMATHFPSDTSWHSWPTLGLPHFSQIIKVHVRSWRPLAKTIPFGSQSWAGG